MEIRLEGQDDLLRNLGKFKDEAVKSALDNGLKAAGMDIIADAKQNLRANGSVVTGRLRASGRVQKAGDLSYDVGFMSNENTYAGAVEYGRRAGKMPPPDELAAYAYKKFQMKDQMNDWKAARSAGWALATIIARRGTKPHPFFVPAVKKNEPKVMAAIQKAIQKTIDKYK